MPVTAKLSRRFYEALGDEVANELVEWFNAVDATYRSELRELNELNFSRFRAEVEAGFARADAALEQRTAELRQDMAGGFSRADVKLEQRAAELRQEVSQHSSALRAEIYGLRAHVDSGVERLRAEMASERADLLKWMFLFWAPTALAVIGLYARR